MEYKITLNKDEIQRVLMALNYYSVKYLHPRMKEEKFYEEEWNENLNLYCKFLRAKKEK